MLPAFESGLWLWKGAGNAVVMALQALSSCHTIFFSKVTKYEPNLQFCCP